MQNNKLVLTLEELKKEGRPLYILGHKGVCYDSLGSAFGLAHIAKHVGLEAKVCGEHTQDWGYPQNNILYNQLELESKIHSPSIITEEDSVAFVDVYPKGTNGYETNGKPVIVINHHPIDDCPVSLGETKTVDIRETGSTVGMITDYMMDPELNIVEPDSALATLMLYGMRVDTKRGLRMTELDYRAAAYLSKHADLDTVQKIESKSYPQEMLNIMKGMNEKEVGKYRIAVVKVPKPGMVPQLADVLNSFEGCVVSMIVAKVEEAGERDWYVSGRSKKPACNVGDLVKELFGSGGGHWYSGGASLTSRDVYSRFKVDENKNSSVLRQVMNALVKRLKVLSNEK